MVEKERLLKYYRQGYTIDAIKDFMGISKEEVLESLKHYRDSQRIGNKYSEELMELIAKRDSYDFTRKNIMEELGISRNFLAKSIEEYGFLNKTTKEAGEEFFMDIPFDFEISECPKCGSLRINEVETVHHDCPTKGYYCVDCGSEFSIKEDKLYTVKWENID